MKKVNKKILWFLSVIFALFIVAVIVTNTVPYFTSPKTINPEDCDALARDRAAKAMMVQEQNPELTDQKGDFESYYKAFLEICLGSGM